MENSSEVSSDLNMETNGTTNGSKEEAESHSATQPEDTTAQSSKAKVLSEAPTEESPKENEEDSDQPEHPEEPRSASENNSQPSEPESEPAPAEQNGKEEEGETEVEAPPAEVSEDSEAGKEAPACTVGDLIDEEEEESPKEDEKPEEETKEDPDPAADKEEMTEESEKVETANEKEEEEITESVLDKENKKEEARSVKQDTKTAAELAYEWDDDGIEDEKPSPAKTPKKKSESKPKGPPVVDVTPGMARRLLRRESRAAKRAADLRRKASTRPWTAWLSSAPTCISTQAQAAPTVPHRWTVTRRTFPSRRRTLSQQGNPVGPIKGAIRG